MTERFSDNESSKRDIPSFIEPRPPLIINPFMRPRPQKATNLLEQFEEDSEVDEPELVQVYLRMKPHDVPNNLYEVRSDKCLVTSLDTTTAGHGRRTQHNVSRMYTFSRIFDAHCGQKEIFEQVVKENLKKLPAGHSFTLLTYGASGSGKTYTLMGTVTSPGLVPRSLEYVFKLVEVSQQPTYKPSEAGADKLGYSQQEFELQWVKKLRQVSAPQRDKYKRMSAQLKNDLTVSNFDLTNTTKYYVWVSFVEIYNEAIYDLLAPPEKRTKLRIREDNTGQVYAKGVTQAFVRTGVEAYDVMIAGKHNLVVAATGVHAHSSRSHCIFTITMLTETGGEIRTSCIRLCDLAGCERASATRNTGTRMQESRAINTSLHVLERCLHLLQRNQKQRHAALVPYRESKLTRLLGSGLSGSRGEALSMVVTLNPSPQYALETKHVLSLATVAQDIQINNTVMFASTLENSSEDSTISSNDELAAEIMKLRSDNELLHFELVQAQAHNKKLVAAMDEKQEQTATTMRELVEEAKDMTRQYYEAQLGFLRSQMEEMIEEYEARLAKPAAISRGTQTTFLQTEDNLAAEKLAHAKEEEVNDLHSRDDDDDDCTDEGDDEVYNNTTNEDLLEVVVTISEDESDPLNESLEPIFRKKYLKRHKAIKLDNEIKMEDDNAEENIMESNDEKDEIEVDGDAIVIDNDTSTDTIKNENEDTPENSDYATGDENEHDSVEIKVDVKKYKNDTTGIISTNVTSKVHDESYTEKKNESNEFKDLCKSDVRGTYFVPDSEQRDKGPNESIEVQSQVRGTYFVRTSAASSSDEDENPVNTEAAELSDPENPRETYFVRASAIDTSIDEEMQEVVEHKSVLEMTPERSLLQAEIKPPAIPETLVSKILKSLKKSTQSNNSDSSLRQFEQLETASEVTVEDSDNKSSGFGDINLLKEKRTYFDEHTTKKTDKLHVTAKIDYSETLISSNKTKNIKDENQAEDEKPLDDKPSCNLEMNMLSEKSNSNKEVLLFKPIPAKRTYFDNIEVNTKTTNKMIADLKTSCKNNCERSPLYGTDEPYEPKAIKKLLGENIAKLEVLSSINTKPLIKKHDSIDVFEGLESPQVKPKVKEVIATPSKTCSNLDEVRKSIEKLVLEQKTRNDIKQDHKLEPMSFVEEDFVIKEPVTVKKAYIIKESVNIVVTGVPKDLNENQSKQDNTIEEFENIYKDLSTHRLTEFDLLARQELDAQDEKNDKKNEKTDEKLSKNEAEVSQTKTEDKYNLRHKDKSVDIDINKRDDEVLLESSSKCESKTKYNKRSLRLRRRKNDEDQDSEKLKDILNLKKEFSDVTLGLPAFKKEVRDIPSPEKVPGDDENLPPLMGIQSCPSKSVTRSRRKLFTPRAEPLEECLSQTGTDSDERIYVPRPSYHRTRARRKL